MIIFFINQYWSSEKRLLNVIINKLFIHAFVLSEWVSSEFVYGIPEQTCSLLISDVFILTYSVLLCEHISEKPSSARYPDRRRCSLPMTSMMSAGASTGNGHTGAVTVIAFMVITAILTPVMGMPSCFCASFHRTDRTAGIRRGLSVMSAVPMSRNRHSQDRKSVV